MGMVSRVGFREGTRICRHRETMLAEGSRGMLLDFLYESMISSVLNIFRSGMRDRTTFEEAMSAEGRLSRRPSILEALRSYNMRAEELFGRNVVGCFGGRIVEAQATCINTRDSSLGGLILGKMKMGIANSNKCSRSAGLFRNFELEARKCDNE